MLICFPLVPGFDFWSFFSNAFGFCYEGKSYEDNVVDIKYMASPFIFYEESHDLSDAQLSVRWSQNYVLLKTSATFMLFPDVLGTTFLVIIYALTMSWSILLRVLWSLQWHEWSRREPFLNLIPLLSINICVRYRSRHGLTFKTHGLSWAMLHFGNELIRTTTAAISETQKLEIEKKNLRERRITTLDLCLWNFLLVVRLSLL